ncbi:septal ring lytic transglycosylase RlpA family protein [Chitinivorax sp. PXF-14]|uniref:septal ring lytic transglycosylase RlpA family protein n=1 Tax=Chitinivorax sp. PXF-14 TaxID=3230488 RepID=UPI0034673B75
MTAPTVVGKAGEERKTTPAIKPGKNGGAFWLDDGPPESVPVDLSKVTEPEPRIEPLNKFANNPYSRFGEDYVPSKELKPYQGEGIASWYGKKFHGQKTSSGERYDMFAMTAAHATLPIPSYARVTNMENGKSVIVRINDRGPFHKNRVMDLSYAAAYKLDYVAKGSARISIEAITADEIAQMKQQGGLLERIAPPKLAKAKSVEKPVADDKPVAVVASAVSTEPKVVSEVLAPAASVTNAAADSISSDTVGNGVYLQVGAFRSKDNAESLRDRLVRGGAELAHEMVNVVTRQGVSRIHIGPYATEAAARLAAGKLRDVLALNSVVVR